MEGDQTMQLKEQILSLVEESRMKLDNKLKLLWLMDKAFKASIGTFYVTDEELEERNILYRSM